MRLQWPRTMQPTCSQVVSPQDVRKLAHPSHCYLNTLYQRYRESLPSTKMGEFENNRRPRYGHPALDRFVCLAMSDIRTLESNVWAIGSLLARRTAISNRLSSGFRTNTEPRRRTVVFSSPSLASVQNGYSLSKFKINAPRLQTPRAPVVVNPA
jgi:hypothetical protein